MRASAVAAERAGSRRDGRRAPRVDGTTGSDLAKLALSYLAGGISLVPCSSSTKQPESRLLPPAADGKASWKLYQTTPANAFAVGMWFIRGCKSVAAIGGKVSGGLLIIDFDAESDRFYSAWSKAVGSLADALPVQRTGGGGIQVYLRCADPGKNDKLAWVPDENEAGGRTVAIETRAEGGYAIMPGSLHPSGLYYEAISGDFAAVPTVDQDVAEALLTAARALDECPLTVEKMEARQKKATEYNKYRTEAGGQASVIDAYNERVSIETELEARGYIRDGNRWKRPEGKSASVAVEEGRGSFHHSSNDPLNDGYWHRPFDVFCKLAHDDDCKAAVKAAAELLGIKLEPQNVTTRQGAGQDLKPVEFRRISCAELDAGNYDLEYLIEGALVARQPCILAGSKKTLKTSLLIDLGISLATGGDFLGRMKVNRACRVGIMTGESGLATIQETSRRIAAAAGWNLAEIENLVFSEDLPQFGSIAHQEALGRFIQADALEVIAVDPAYMCIPEVDHASIFSMGPVLRGVSQVCQDQGALLLIAHHAKKAKADPFSPMELEDISWAGFQEFARQWLLLGRRELYQPGTGEHRLWLSAGGSAGHSGLWAVDVTEGTRETPGGRFWQVAVMPQSEARKDTDTRRQESRRQRDKERAATTLENDRREMVQVAVSLKTPQTETGLRQNVSFQRERFKLAFTSLVEEGVFQPVQIIKGNNRPYDA